MTDVRHSMPTVMKVKKLAEAGCCPTEIVDFLQQQGTHVTRDSVRRWTDPEYAEMKRAGQREAQARKRAERRSGPNAILIRMQTLRQAGLSHAAIGIVVGIDFYQGRPMGADHVRRVLAQGRMPRPYTRPKARA